MAIDGTGLFAPLTGSGSGAYAGTGSFREWTATGSLAPAGAGSFSAWTASGAGCRAGEGSFAAWTANGGLRGRADVEFLPWTADGAAAADAGAAAVEFEVWTATGTASDPFIHAAGGGEFAKWTAYGTMPGRGDAVFEPWTATGRIRSPIHGLASFEPWASDSRSGYAQLEAWIASGAASQGVPNTFFVGVMNARSKGVTEYSNHNFNSFARIGTRWYAAGPGGLYLLGGEDDHGTPIAWLVRTGQMDGKDPGLKRLPEVLLGLRSSGKIRVRVYPDDVVHYDYILPAVKTDTIHQHRVKVGKGMRSRYYSVELQGVDGSDLELDSMQVNMTETGRRLG